MGQRLKTKSDDRMPLTEALDKLKAKYPWAPIQSLRKQVNRIPSVRSSFAKRARWYVRFEDLEKLLLRTENNKEETS